MNSSFFGVDRGKRRRKMSAGDVTIKTWNFMIPSKPFTRLIEDFMLLERIPNLDISILPPSFPLIMAKDQRRRDFRIVSSAGYSILETWRWFVFWEADFNDKQFILLRSFLPVGRYYHCTILYKPGLVLRKLHSPFLGKFFDVEVSWRCVSLCLCSSRLMTIWLK